MVVPILKQGECLIVSIQSELTDEELMGLHHELLVQVRRHRARGVVVDVTVLDVLDSFSTRMLRDTALAVQLCGAKAVVVGIQPEVAFAMVKLGLVLDGVPTALDLQEGLALLGREKRGHEHEH